MAQKHDIPEYIDAPMTRASTLTLTAQRRQIRSDAFTADKWAEVNPILQLGEIGYETDTNKLKVGDGVTEWTDLGYVGGGDDHNKGYFATESALTTAHPTAEAGDWAIVGATDTVWIWDDDTSAWIDSDQKGQVTSVNGQTGAVVLSIPTITVITED